MTLLQRHGTSNGTSRGIVPALYFILLTLFFAVVSELPAQITITQPGANARIVAQGQFLIQWTGTSPNDTVRIEFSADNGRSWQLVTAAATGNQYLWNPVPVIVSEQCIIRIVTGIRNDANPFILRNTFPIFYGTNRLERTARSRFASFSPDGTKILAFANNLNPNTPNDSVQLYQVQVWDAATGRLRSILSSFLANTRLFTLPRWQWNDNAVPWLKDWWSSDSRRIVSPVGNDTTFGIFNATITDGQPDLIVTLPTLGSRRALRQLRWGRNDREIIADVLYRSVGSDSTFVAILRFNPNNGALLGQITIQNNESTPLEIISFRGYSNDGTRYVRSYFDRSSREITRLGVFNSFTGDAVATLRPPQGWKWRQYAGANNIGMWSPDDSLMAMVSEPQATNMNLSAIPETVILNTWTGNIVQRVPARPTPEPIVWSSDSKNLLLYNGQDDFARDVYNVPLGRIDPLLRLNNLTTTQFGGAGAFNFNTYNIAWSNNMKRIAGYVRPFDPFNPTLGIWDAEQGCLLQTVRLPLVAPDPNVSLTVAEQLRWTGALSWSNDDSKLLLQNFLSDTTLIIPVPNFISPCKQGSSGSEFIIRTRSDFVVQEVHTFPTIVCESSATISVPFRNVSTIAQNVQATLQRIDETINPVADFQILGARNVQLQAGASGEIRVQFTPTFFGRKSAYINFNLGLNIPPQRTLLVAVKDTIDITPREAMLDFGLVPANTTTTASIVLKNTGTAEIVWNTNATFSANRNFWVESFIPPVTQVNEESRAVVRFAGLPTTATITDSLSLFQCLDRRFPLRIQARVLPEFPQIQVTDSVAFGRLVCGTNTEATITVRNVGGRRLDVFSGVPSNADFRIVNQGLQGQGFPFSLAPLESRSVRILYEPRREGVSTGLLAIRSNDPEVGSVSTRLRAEKQSLQYMMSDSVIEFLDIPERQESVQSTLFRNRTNQSVSIARLPLRMTNDIVLERVSPNPLSPDGTAELTFRFAGRNEQVEFSTVGTIPLTDICQTPFPVRFNVRVGEPRPRLTFQTAVGFDTVGCTATTDATVLLRSTGGRPLIIDSIIVEPVTAGQAGEPSAFQLLNVVPATFPLILQSRGQENSTFPLALRFRPSRLGGFEGAIRIISNDTVTTANRTQRLALFGRRDSISFLLNRQSLNLVTMQAQSPVLDTIVVTNTGTRTLDWSGIPRRLNEVFTVEQIEPLETPPNGVSRIIVRFSGGAFGLSSQTELHVVPTQCSQTLQSVIIRGVVGRQALIDVPSNVSARFVCEDIQRVPIVVRSVGSDVLTLEGVELLESGSTPTSAFRLTRVPTQIAAGGRTDTIFLDLISRLQGVYSTRIRFRTNSGNQPIVEIPCTVRKDSLGIRFVPATADFGSLRLQTTATLRVSIENTGNLAQTLTFPAQLSPFIVQVQSQMVLPAQATASFTLGFASVTGGTFSTMLRTQDSCGRATTLPIIARVVSGRFALPDTIFIGQGQDMQVPVRLTGRSSAFMGLPSAFRLRVGNASMLEVRSPMPETTVVQNGVRLYTFVSRIASDSDTAAVLQLSLRGLLGNDTLTTFTIDNASVGGVAVTGVQSVVRAIGLNYVNGRPRLYYTSPVIIKALAPNPVQDGISLSLEALEATSAQVFLTDVLGKRTLLRELTFLQGLHSVYLPLSSFSSGVYSIEILCNNQTRTSAQIQILR